MQQVNAMNSTRRDMEWPIVGHAWAVRQLQLAVQRDEVPHAILFSGPESVGKMTLARTVGAALLCDNHDGHRPCGVCLACRKLASGNHPDFLLVEPEDKAGSLKVEQIRDLERFLALTPHESTCKIVLIRAFEKATIGAANALLKTLEEPPPYAHLLLLAEDADLLLPTIVSRSRQIHLRPLSTRSVAKALVERWQVSEPVAECLARISGGRIGWAVKAVTEPEHRQSMEQALTTLLEILRQDLPTRFETAHTLAQASVQLEEILAYWITAWRDVLLLQTGTATPIVHQEYDGALRQLARDLDLQITVQTLEELERTQTALHRNANTQLLVENLLLILPTL
ncbi:MAG: DNA polymerase III subunit delta' [Anaerolineae bacterium]|nr:DNA polymerase III subunit delta' [Anaerolineae bacterium]